MGEFDKEERNLRGLIEILKQNYNLNAGGNSEAQAASKKSPPIKWKTTKPKKKKGIGGLLSRLRDPDPLNKRERLMLDNALKAESILNRTDEGALMGLRSKYPTF